MLIRALIVLLFVLNLGVAVWWWNRDDARPAALPELPAGVARLELVNQGDIAVNATPVAAQPAIPAICVRLGPFADRDLAEQASSRLGSGVINVRSREVPGAGASAYNVLLPPAASREAALALAQRISAAGFNDLLVINDGTDAKAIALGRYRSHDSALRRQAELTAAGFPAEVRASGRGAASQWWLEVGASAAIDADDLRTRSGAGRAEPLDCAVR